MREVVWKWEDMHKVEDCGEIVSENKIEKKRKYLINKYFLLKIIFCLINRVFSKMGFVAQILFSF